jgi:proteasome lid subunit RPN8/RPN11
MRLTISLTSKHIDEIITHAREASPNECCGLIGGTDAVVRTIYRARNVSAAPLVAYEAAPEDLFRAQRKMRESGEELIGIYHSHPRASEPRPSETDVRLAYYPSAVYLILGLGNSEPCLRAFRISEREDTWEQVEFKVISNDNE